jgi:hypothetical protein
MVVGDVFWHELSVQVKARDKFRNWPDLEYN